MARKKADFHYPGGYTTEQAYENAKKYRQTYAEQMYKRYTFRIPYESQGLIDMLDKIDNVNGYMRKLLEDEYRKYERVAKRENITIAQAIKKEQER